MGTPIEDARTALDNFDAHGVIFGPDVATAIRALIAEHERLIAMQPGEEHGEAIYSPEVFESMNGYLASANGSPMLALRLAVSERLIAPPTDDEHPLDALWDGTPSTARAIANAKARERLTALPSDDEREALAEALYDLDPVTFPVHPLGDGTYDDREELAWLAWTEFVRHDPESADAYREDAAKLMAAGFRRQDHPTTDAFREIRARIAQEDVPIHLAADIEQIICETGGDFGDESDEAARKES